MRIWFILRRNMIEAREPVGDELFEPREPCEELLYELAYDQGSDLDRIYRLRGGLGFFQTAFGSAFFNHHTPEVLDAFQGDHVTPEEYAVLRTHLFTHACQAAKKRAPRRQPA